MMESICLSLCAPALITSKRMVRVCFERVNLPRIIIYTALGLLQEGIYRSSGLKTRVMELRRAYNDRENVVLSDIEAPIVASLLKQYLR